MEMLTMPLDVILWKGGKDLTVVFIMSQRKPDKGLVKFFNVFIMMMFEGFLTNAQHDQG